MSAFVSLTFISLPEAALRVALAMVLGLILGWDRESKNKPIDFRAYMIVAVTTCIVAMLGQEIAAQFADMNKIIHVDLSKVIAGVLTGIGFLGAGAIIQGDNNNVIGTATGASIWAAGGIGLALGFGFYALALLAFVAIALILIGGGWLMECCLDKKDKGPKGK